MATIRWTPGQMHLADALTKNSQVVSRLLDATLKSGLHSHQEFSYTTAAATTVKKQSRDVLARTQLSDSLGEA